MRLDTQTNDIIINRGVERVAGIAYIAQLTKTRLSLLLGEWDLDETLGIDWFGIMGKNYDLSIIQGIVSDTIRATTGVTELTSVELTLDKATRKLKIAFEAIGNGEVFTETVII